MGKGGKGAHHHHHRSRSSYSGGRNRGGFGLDYELELRNGEARASFVMDHGRFGPQGALGGEDGEVNKVVVIRDGEPYVPLHLSKEQDIALAPGDRVWVRTPGGGGYGDPLERPPESVLEDVRLGRYTAAQAHDLYGVVISEADEPEIDPRRKDPPPSRPGPGRSPMALPMVGTGDDKVDVLSRLLRSRCNSVTAIRFSTIRGTPRRYLLVPCSPQSFGRCCYYYS